MPKIKDTMTRPEMVDFVTRSLAGQEADYDVEGIVDHLRCIVGDRHLELVEPDVYWRAVLSPEHSR